MYCRTRRSYADTNADTKRDSYSDPNTNADTKRDSYSDPNPRADTKRDSYSDIDADAGQLYPLWLDQRCRSRSKGPK